ncbi:MAG TPA: hypothetical protein VG944_13260 [Fimbriimonas sp.]|nr:hypothetical protein [Fimbriimonas sp.]
MRGWVAVGLWAAATVGAWAQVSGFSVPDGPRHFIVLVDSSFSMEATSQKPTPPGAKRAALRRAEDALASLLFDRGSEVPNQPWYRKGRDLLSVLYYGIDRQSQAASAYLRLRYADLGQDYMRVGALHSSSATKARFRKLLHPPFRTQLNILAWAMPLGVRSAAVSEHMSVQQTYVILLNDAQMNDGSMVLEDSTLSRHLSANVRQRLQQRQRQFTQLVRLTDANGQPQPLLTRGFGEYRDQVVITAFRATPTTTAAAVAKYEPVRALASSSVFRRGNTPAAVIQPPSLLRGRQAEVRLDGDHVNVASKPFRLADRNSVALSLGRAPADSTAATLRLAVLDHASNPLLGQQAFDVNFDKAVVLPEGPGTLAAKVRYWGILVLAAGLAFAAAGWYAYHRLVARHFRLWLPDYSQGLSLPPMRQGGTVHYITRMASSQSEAAAYLELPSPLIRRLFYPALRVHRDPRLVLLRAPSLADEATSVVTPDLPRFLELVWIERPLSAGMFDLSIEQQTRSGKSLLVQATIRFSGMRPINASPPR